MHNYIQLYTAEYSYTQLYTDLYTAEYNYTQLYTAIHSYIQLSIHMTLTVTPGQPPHSVLFKVAQYTNVSALSWSPACGCQQVLAVSQLAAAFAYLHTNLYTSIILYTSIVYIHKYSNARHRAQPTTAAAHKEGEGPPPS